MQKERRFSRVRCLENCTVETGSATSEVKLLDISLRGALVEHDSGLPVSRGDRWKITFRLNHSDIVLQFDAEVIHCHEMTAGVKFVEMDLDTLTHLRSLLEARTVNPDLVRHELGFMIDEYE